MKKNIWNRVLMSLASVISVFALVASVAPCKGSFYQPEVPEQLRK